MAGMFTMLKGSALYVAGGLVLAVVGAATYLASQSVLSGSDWLAVITPILAGIVGVTSAHVAGQTAATAFNTAPPQLPQPIPAQGQVTAVGPPEEVI